ncbi:MAG: hypothetical protein R3C26_08430 [Calditrichia bacterium]
MIAKYDGYTVTNFTHIPGDTTTISDNTVRAILRRCQRQFVDRHFRWTKPCWRSHRRSSAVNPGTVLSASGIHRMTV